MFAANLFSPTFCSAFGSRASSVAGGVPIEILKALKLESNSSKCLRGPRIIAVAGNLGDLWGEQHRIETRTKPNHSWVNSGRLMIGGNYSRSPYDCCA